MKRKKKKLKVYGSRIKVCVETLVQVGFKDQSLQTLPEVVIIVCRHSIGQGAARAGPLNASIKKENATAVVPGNIRASFTAVLRAKSAHEANRPVFARLVWA